MGVLERRKQRIQRVKKILRLLPQKAQLERYPVLGRFANSARKSAFLWSFREDEVIPAFLAGWVITLMPIMGVQIPVAILCAFLFRANVLILTALQLISNVFTVPILWPLLYQVGHSVIWLLGNESVRHLPSSTGGDWILRATATTTLGGVLTGYLATLISCGFYRLFHRYLARERELHQVILRSRLNRRLHQASLLKNSRTKP